MKRLLYILLVLGLALLLGCSGEDKEHKDKTPPARPKMIPHYGDTGDDQVEIDGVMTILTDENNGIDAVPEGQWMRISWAPFKDSDLSHLKIYRFSDIEPDSLEIAQIPANQYSYLDQGPLVERCWYSYYIELFDASGNSAISDTVSYAILAKPQLISPANGAALSASEIRFMWDVADDQSGFYRVLVWDEYNDLLWSDELHLATEDPPLSMPFPHITPAPAPGSALRWRVDYFDWDEEHQMNMGSESNERILYLR